jgi:hypothetical protein
MPWSTTREDKIRQYCPVIAADLTNWPKEKLWTRWDSAFVECQSKLCPPLTSATFALLNAADTNSASGNELIAQVAAYLIYCELPTGVTTTAKETLKARIYGADTQFGHDTGYFEEIQSGDRNVLDSASVAIPRACHLASTTEDYPSLMTLDTRDADGALVTPGTLSDLSPAL